MPFFTLILPCYKVAAYVERCVRSILAQDFTDYQIILVDDGSPDETPAICDRLAAEHDCILVIHKENGGLSSARNAGLEIAQGQYVWFVDSDDWIEPGALRLLHAACTDGKPEIVKFSHYRVTETSAAVPHHVEPGLYAGTERCDVLRRKALCEAGRYCLSACFHVYRRSFLQKRHMGKYSMGFISEQIVGSEDYLFNLQLLLGAECVRVLEEPLYSYELRQGSLTQTYKSDLFQRYAALHQQLRAYAQQSGQDRYLPLIDRFFLWHLLVGTCMTQEYLTEAHPAAKARRNVRRMLGTPEVRRALRGADTAGLSTQKRLQLLAMRLKFEGLFYYLFVRRPAGKR